MTTQTVVEQTRRLNYGLTEPLDWFQLRAMLWEACEDRTPPSSDRWEGVASCVNARCTGSTPTRPTPTVRSSSALRPSFPSVRHLRRSRRGAAPVDAALVRDGA